MNRSLSNKDDGQEHLKTLKKYMEKLRDKKSIFGKEYFSVQREEQKGEKVERKRYGRIHEILEYK